MKENNIKILTQIEHVLKRTGRYVGCTNHISQNMFQLNKDNVMEYKEVKYVPALIKIIREIIDNSCDEYVRTNGKFAKNIKVNCSEDGWISIKDDGRGIPIKKFDNGMYTPEAAWTELRAGANFDDEEDNTTIGQNGEGAALTCILSKEFHGITADSKNIFTMVCKDNLSDKTIQVKKSIEHFTQVRFLPDYQRFDLPNGLNDVHKDLIKTDLYNLAMCYPKINFFFNDKKITGKSFINYIEQFKVPFEIYDEDNICLAILQNNTDDFNYVHYVNGANVYEGGNPFNGMFDLVYDNLKDTIGKAKKIKTIKKGDVKNKTTFVLFIRNLPNPRFDNQIKSRCINQMSEIKSFIHERHLDNFIKKVTKNEEIVTPIVESFQLKEDMKHLKGLTSLEKNKKIKCDKYLSSIGENKYLTLCEGDSAKGGLSNVLGRRQIGYFAMKGVPLNSYELNLKKMLENEEITNIIQILGLKLSDKDSRDCNFENVLIATDADLDGFHITGLLLGFLEKYAKWMFDNNKVKRLRTPIVVLKNKNKIVKFFFNFNEFNEYCNNNDISKLELDYKKGLGSWNKEELQQLIKEHGFEYFIEDMKLCSQGQKSIHNWLSKTTSDTRKELLRNNNFNIFNI